MKLAATTVVRGSRAGESHGGAFLIDLDAREARAVVAAERAAGVPRGRDRDAGLRGIAFDGETVYIAASDALLAFTPDFRPAGAWRNPYLQDCQGIAAWERRLFVASAGCDAILGFDLDRREFDWAMQVMARDFHFNPRSFDPRRDDGPLMLDKLHLQDLHCAQGGMYVTGLRTGGMLLFNGRELQMAVELPPGARDARPYRDGVLFNDGEAGFLRYAGREGAEDRAFRIPPPGPAHGLAVLPGSLVAGGSSPATVTLYDLPRNARLLSVALASDQRSVIHSLAAWPY